MATYKITYTYEDKDNSQARCSSVRVVANSETEARQLFAKSDKDYMQGPHLGPAIIINVQHFVD